MYVEIEEALERETASACIDARLQQLGVAVVSRETYFAWRYHGGDAYSGGTWSAVGSQAGSSGWAGLGYAAYCNIAIPPPRGLHFTPPFRLRKRNSDRHRAGLRGGSRAMAEEELSPAQQLAIAANFVSNSPPAQASNVLDGPLPPHRASGHGLC